MIIIIWHESMKQAKRIITLNKEGSWKCYFLSKWQSALWSYKWDKKRKKNSHWPYKSCLIILRKKSKYYTLWWILSAFPTSTLSICSRVEFWSHILERSIQIHNLMRRLLCKSSFIREMVLMFHLKNDFFILPEISGYQLSPNMVMCALINERCFHDIRFSIKIYFALWKTFVFCLFCQTVVWPGT